MTTGIARRAALVSAARLGNQAIALLSPIILVRLLPVEAFGEYRRFFLYFNLLSVVALMGVNSSLLYFIPRAPEGLWHTIRRSVNLVAVSSCAITALVWIGDHLSGGLLIGDGLTAVLIYTLLFVNLDFWESLALARKQPLLVLGYSMGRLVARMTTVIVTAAMTSDVNAIISSLIAVETVRIALSALAWWRFSDVKSEPANAGPAWREIVAYAWPVGLSVLVLTFSRSAGALVVERFEGEVGLAYLTVGGFVYVIVSTVRNSISDVLLPEMSAAGQREAGGELSLWRRSTVIFAILLVPPAVLMFSFAEPIVTLLFSTRYLPAVPVFQVYVLILIRECFDFDLAFRASGMTRKGLRGHVVTLILNVALSLLLVPMLGIIGAALALVISRGLIAIYLARQVAAMANLRARELFPWGDLAKVLAAAFISAAVLVPALVFPRYGWLAIVSASFVFGLLFFIILKKWDVAEVRWMFELLGRRLGLRHS